MAKFVARKPEKEVISMRISTDTLQILDDKSAEIGISRNEKNKNHRNKVLLPSAVVFIYSMSITVSRCNRKYKCVCGLSVTI